MRRRKSNPSSSTNPNPASWGFLTPASEIIIETIKELAYKYGFNAMSGYSSSSFHGEQSTYKIDFEKFNSINNYREVLSIKYYIEDGRMDFTFNNIDAENSFDIFKNIFDINAGTKKEISESQGTELTQPIIDCPACGAKYKNQ